MLIDGLIALILSITGAIFTSLRPNNARVAGGGCAAARERAVSEPIELGEGPVMRICLSAIWDEKVLTTSAPVVLRLKEEDMMALGKGG